MGRRPNPLILTYFDRGAKIEDSSNRYEFICKKCRVVIPKGRPETLYQHIGRKCPALTADERATAVACISEQAISTGYAASKLSVKHTLPSADKPRKRSRATVREPSALDTLAEVSRQRLDHTTEPLQVTGAASDELEWFASLQQQLEDVTSDPIEPTVRQDPVGFEDSHRDAEAPNTADEIRAESFAALPSLGAQSQSQGSLDPELRGAHETNCQTSSLIETVDPIPDNVFRSPHETEYQPLDADRPDLDTPIQLQPQQPQIRPHSSLHQPLARATRNRFSEARRIEVSGIRKLGACIRCRMLKKPCSDGSPCDQCKSLVSARIWTHGCIRTRLMDELQFYPTGLFQARCQSSINRLLPDSTPDKVSGQVAAALINETEVLTLHATAVYFSRKESTQSLPHDETSESSSIVLFNHNDKENWTLIGGYLARIKTSIVFKEESTSVKATIETALSQLESNLDILLARTVELWVATQVLIGIEGAWTVSYTENQSQSDESPQNDRVTSDLDRQSVNHHIIEAQIMEMIGQYANKLCVAVLRQLEQRIVARKRSSIFTTFMSSVVLLNSVERMSLFVRRQGKDMVNYDAAGEANTQESNSPWPLLQPPSFYLARSTRFTDILCSMLRVRGILPHLHTVSENGTEWALRIQSSKDDEQTPPSAVKRAEEYALNQACAKWLSATGLSMNLLRAAGNIDEGTVSEDPMAWDHKLLASLLIDGPAA